MICRMKTRQSGNVLFLILIAVVLFAALSYVVTQSTRTNAGSTESEKAQLNASQMINFVTLLKTAVTRMLLVNGCSETQLNFTNDVYVTTAGVHLMTNNPTSPLDGRCNVFDPRGGFVSPLFPPPEALAPSSTIYQPGHGYMRVIQILGIGTDGTTGTVSANDLVFVQANISKPTCVAINKLLGVSNPGGDAPTFDATGWTNFNSSFASAGLVNTSELVGRHMFCAYSPLSSVYAFVTVVLER